MVNGNFLMGYGNILWISLFGAMVILLLISKKSVFHATKKVTIVYFWLRS